jgi:hypothetical protein
LRIRDTLGDMEPVRQFGAAFNHMMKGEVIDDL